MSAPEDEPRVGSLGEETLKLIGALAGDGGEPREHTGSSCRWCPVCQVVDVVREASPEVLDHLGDSLESLAAAVRELTTHLAHRDRSNDDTRRPPEPRKPGGVETIDLAEDEPWD
ncbi:hypothetical protein [Solicola sp. PLA-1-18]|uniref:hypothetical protein n=1 Tax=Solicola sp. PLA-1-18 TaxID=3380532 RepID=UPI003B81A5D9